MSRLVVWGLVAAVVAVQIPYPLVHGTARDVLTVVTVVVFAAASATAAAVSGRWWHGVALVAVVAAGGFVAEVVGVHTGYPFGRYRYLHGLGPTAAGVPLVVPLAWVMMMQPAIAVARRVVSSTAARIAVGAVALAAWDVFLDPQMVTAHHWRWSDPHPHLAGVADVPLSNFGGWLLVALVLVAVTQLWSRGAGADRPAVTLWVWTWLSSTLANLVFFSRPAVAAWGFVAMGLVGVPLLWKTAR